MPMHDWTRVEAAISHAFHHEWISEIGRTLNRSLPPSYYALPEQQAAGFGPDVLTLQDQNLTPNQTGGTTTLTRPRPKTTHVIEAPAEFHRKKKSTIVVRHVSGDRIVAMVEIVSPGNKNTRHAIRAFVSKACELLSHKIHLLLIDPFPPSKRDPNGLHASIFKHVQDDPLKLTTAKPLALMSYECTEPIRGYIEPLAVGDVLPTMPLFLEPEVFVDVPLETTYMAAWEVVPRRWREVVAPKNS